MGKNQVTLQYNKYVERFIEVSSDSIFIVRWKMEQIECFETSAYKIQTPGNYAKENVIYSEHGESLK